MVPGDQLAKFAWARASATEAKPSHHAVDISGWMFAVSIHRKVQEVTFINRSSLWKWSRWDGSIIGLIWNYIMGHAHILLEIPSHNIGRAWPIVHFYWVSKKSFTPPISCTVIYPSYLLSIRGLSLIQIGTDFTLADRTDIVSISKPSPKSRQSCEWQFFNWFEPPCSQK
jgi:hypothetical protein